MTRAMKSAAAAVCLLAASLSEGVGPTAASPRTGDRALRVLILSGRGNHDWRATTSFLRHLLEDTGRFRVRVCEAPGGLTALTDFDVLVDDGGGSGTNLERLNVGGTAIGWWARWRLRRAFPRLRVLTRFVA